MKKSNKKLLENSALYTGATLLLRCFSFLLLPLYTRYLTPSDYGINNIVTGFTGVATILIIVSMHSATPKFYVEYREDHEKIRRYFGTIMMFPIISGILLSVSYFAVHNILDNILFENIPYFPIIFISMISLVFAGTQTMYVSILQAMQDGRRAVLRSIVVFFIGLIFNILFVVFLKMGALGVILSTLIYNSLLFIYSIFDLKKRGLFKFCIDFKILKENVVYSVFLIPHILSSTIAAWISKLFINSNFQLGTVGIFGVASQFGSVADLIQSAVNTAVMPWVFSLIKEDKKENNKTIQVYSRSLCWIYCAIFMLLALFNQEVILLFLDKSYAESWTVVPLIVATYFIKIVYSFYINLLLYSKKASKTVFIATLSGSAINLILSYFLIPRWGLYGSVVADIIAMIIRVGIIVFLSRGYNVVGYKLRDFCPTIIMAMVLTGVGLIFSYTKYMYQVNIFNILYKLAICAVFFAVLFFRNKSAIMGVVKDIFKNRAQKKKLA